MKKLMSSNIMRALCMGAMLVLMIAFVPVVKADAASTTPATFYIMPDGSSSYVSVGQGSIASPITSKDKNIVTKNIVSIPDLSKYVNQYQYVEWTTISKSSSGKFSVKGKVITTFISNDSFMSPGEVEGFSATFYIMPEGATSYINVGQGMISISSSSKVRETVEKSILDTPDLSKYVASNQKVEWTAISKSSSGKLSVKGLVKTVAAPNKVEMLPQITVKPELNTNANVSIDKAELNDIYSIIKNMFETGDMSVRDISSLNVTTTEVYKAYRDYIHGEGYSHYAASSQTYLGNLGIKNGYCTTAQLVGMDADYVNRYNKMMAKVNTVISMMSPEMKPIEKVLIAHDYINENTKYDASTPICGTAAGILVNGRGKCVGYADALNLILHEVGITTYGVSSTDMNHAWSYVEIDGNVYHVDCTWDSSATDLKNMKYRRYYLMASDERFQQSIPRRHYNYIVDQYAGMERPDVAATSTKYDNWFVHDVSSRMLYSNGMWYYANGTKLMRSNIEGTNQSVVLTESSDICIMSLSQGVLQYKVNGVTKTIKIN